MRQTVKLTIAYVVLSLVLGQTAAGCEDDNTTALRTCFESLKDDLLDQDPANTTEFFCGADQKERLQCVIEHFVACPELKNSSYIRDLQTSRTSFHVLELFTVASADDFCDCSWHGTCVVEIDADLLFQSLDGWPWTRMVNLVYTCGAAQTNIHCASSAPPKCAEYLQFKKDDLDIDTLKQVSTLANKRCRASSASMNLDCTTQRARWKTVALCYNQSQNFRSEQDRACGSRSCVEQYMGSCPDGEMERFIDVVNIVNKEKIDTESCRMNSAVQALPNAVTTLTLSFVLVFFIML